MRRFSLMLMVFLLIGLVSAECDFPIDDFESGITDWSVTVGTLSLGEEGGNGFLVADVSGGNDVFMNNVGIGESLIGYNLTFRYRFVEQPGEGGRYVGISDLPDDFDCDANSNCWSSFRSDYNAFAGNEVGIWYTYNKEIGLFENDGSAGDGIGSITLEPPSKVEIDDIKVIKSKYYECSGWGSCFLGSQSRQCTETENCSTPRPDESRPCFMWEIVVIVPVLIVAAYFLRPKKKPKKKTKRKKKS
jgi:hypothetical protein